MLSLCAKFHNLSTVPSKKIEVGVLVSCEATLDNTQNVHPSVHIPVKEFDVSSPSRDLKFCKELNL